MKGVVRHSYADPSQFAALSRAIDFNELGMGLMRSGRYADAHKAFTESLAIKEAAVGRKSIQCALSLMNIGDNYLSWGKLDEAAARYSRELLDDIKQARAKRAAEAVAASTKGSGTGGAVAGNGATVSGGTSRTKCRKCGVESESKRQAAADRGVAFLQRCAKCRSTLYCSKLCQEADWKAHKATCTAAPPAGAN